MNDVPALFWLLCSIILMEIGVILLIVGYRTLRIPQDEWDREARKQWEAKRKNEALLSGLHGRKPLSTEERS